MNGIGSGSFGTLGAFKPVSGTGMVVLRNEVSAFGGEFGRKPSSHFFDRGRPSEDDGNGRVVVLTNGILVLDVVP